MKRQSLAVVFWMLTGIALISGTAMAAEPPVSAAQRDMEDRFSAKLDSITQKQNEILAQLAEIKEELNVVKIRATLKG